MRYSSLWWCRTPKMCPALVVGVPPLEGPIHAQAAVHASVPTGGKESCFLFRVFTIKWTSTTTVLEVFIYLPNYQFECQNVNTILLSKLFITSPNILPRIKSIMVTHHNKHASSQSLTSSLSPFRWFQPWCLWFFSIPPHPHSQQLSR